MRSLPARWLLVLLALAGSLWAHPARAAEVARFSPEGTVKKVRQVAAVFSEPMVAFGDPRAADPFDVQCAEPGTGRWVDAARWVYDFARDLPAGLRCTFTLRSGLTALGGGAVTGRTSFAFSTGGPAIRASVPREGAPGIDEEQAFALLLDAEPVEASLRQHVGFSVEGLAERVGFRVLTGAARERILSRFAEPPRGPVIVMQALQRFPNRARVTLIWGTGVQAASGVATASEQRLSFRVRDAFTATFECERLSKNAGCLPIAPMRLRFSGPIAAAEARRVALRGPDGRQWRPELAEAGAPWVDRLAFRGPFPERARLRLELPPDLRDDAGRPLVNVARFPLEVVTDEFPPLAKFPARFGIAEANASPALPVTVRNLEPEVMGRMVEISGAPRDWKEWVKGRIFRLPPSRAADVLPWLRRVGTAERDRSVFADGTPGPAPTAFSLPKPTGAAEMEVVGIPFKGPGFYVVELSSLRLGAALLGKREPMYVPAAALVTNLAVHFKWGVARSLVWVTALDTGKPVDGARVAIHDCRGAVVYSGATDAQGLAMVDGLPVRDALPRCSTDYRSYDVLGQLDTGLFVTAQRGDDLAFVHSSWNQGIESWRFRVPTSGGEEGILAHTILDRALFRAGETVGMKHLIRRPVAQGFAAVPAAERPTAALVRHLGSNETYDLRLAWDAGGIALDTWAIPKTAKLGAYEVVLRGPARGDVTPEVVSARLSVQEFRVPLMKAVLRAPAEPLVAVSELPVDIAVQYLAGGGAARLPVVLRAQVGARPSPSFEGFEAFTFANGQVREGIVRRAAGGDEYFEDEEPGDGDAPPGRAPRAPAVHQRLELTLDAAGTARATISRLPASITPRDVTAELEFRDPNGEVQTVSTRVPLWPAAQLVGLRPEDWAGTRERLRSQFAVVDVRGRPVAGAAVEVDLFARRFYSYRKRLVGGFYAYEHVEETTKAGSFCRGVTDAKGLLDCEAVPTVSGRVVLQAQTVDAAGRRSVANQEVWIAGADDWWFDARDSDRIDLLPEARRYEPGEVARLQVRMPFREATALVAVEREGVLDAKVVALSGKEPIVEVPITGSFAPNVFVSALVVRGRVGGVEPTALVDLGRPAFKLGIAEIKVGWRDHELQVRVSPDRPVYHTRERARAVVVVRTADGRPPPAGSEIAVAAVDEGLLELSPNTSWNLLDAMMRRRAYAVDNATAQMYVVGKRHFGKKALPQGGGGGRQPTRELFDTLLLWAPRVPLGPDGSATIEVPLNDSLTGVRIVAVAAGGEGLFGTGAASIRTTQDLMVLPGIAPIAREGDRVRAQVTLRNATARPMDVSARARVTGLAGALPARDVTLAAGEARAVGWDVSVPVGVASLRWEVEASERGGATDRVLVTQRVLSAVPVRVYQATLARAPVTQAVERPPDALAGRGGIGVALNPTLVGGLGGVRDWMRRYPYTCLEQRISRAVALGDEAGWREIAGALSGYLDADGLLKYFPTLPEGSEVLTAYALAVVDEAGWAVPPDVLKRATAGLEKFVKGSIARRALLPTADLSIRKLAAVEALARHGARNPALLDSVPVEPSLWPTSAVLDWWSVLRRMPAMKDRDPRLREAEQIVRARLDVQGTALRFSTERGDDLWWLMVSGDVNAGRLLLSLLDAGLWKDDVPRIASGAVGRQRRGAWDTTVANAWGALAVEKFARAYESTPVTGVATASLGGRDQRVDWTATPTGAAVVFPWPAQREELRVEQAGTGAPWVAIEARAALRLAAPLWSGYRITRTLAPVEPRSPSPWRSGDLVRVRLEIEAQGDMTWVVVDDPVPAGATVLGSGLARDPQIAVQNEARRGAWPAFTERAFDAFRAYYAFVPKGTTVVEYTMRLNQGGVFELPPTRVEALYAPSVFGELPNPALAVDP